MPDRDIVHGELGHRYQKPYRQLCEGVPSDRVTRSLTGSLIKDIQHYGNAPVEFLNRVSELLDVPPISRPTYDWSEVSQRIDRLALEAGGNNRRAISIAVRASKRLKEETRQGQIHDDLGLELTKKYVEEIYQSNFSESVPLTPEHHRNIDQETIERRLDELAPYLQKVSYALARQIRRKGGVANLRRPPTSRPSYSLETNLLSSENG